MKKLIAWIDDRDLKKVKNIDGRYLFPDRRLTAYDKHWYDGHCRRVEIILTEELQ